MIDDSEAIEMMGTDSTGLVDIFAYEGVVPSESGQGDSIGYMVIITQQIDTVNGVYQMTQTYVTADGKAGQQMKSKGKKLFQAISGMPFRKLRDYAGRLFPFDSPDTHDTYGLQTVHPGMPQQPQFRICRENHGQDAVCRKMFRGDRFVFAEGASAADQLYLQSLCRHNITSNTSFGWS